MIDRREFVGSSLLVASGLALSPAARTAGAAADEAITVSPIAEGMSLITGAGANVVAVKGPEGLVLVDGGTQKRSRDVVKAALLATGTRKVQALFNTHWHPEQTGSNEALGKEGVKIIAHVNTKLWLTRKISVNWRPGSYGPLPAKALPNDTTYSKGSLALGEEQADYGYMPQAHTDGDIYVFFRKANVLVGGGVVSADRWPVVDWQTGGWIAGLIAGLDSLIKVADEHSKIVPADGPVLTLADLKTQRAAYFGIYDKLVKCLTKGLSPEETLTTEPAKDVNPSWGDPSQFVTASFKSLWGHYAADA